jgi:hypothetical protein
MSVEATFSAPPTTRGAARKPEESIKKGCSLRPREDREATQAV